VPTSSLGSVARLLRVTTLAGMATKLGVLRPISARDLRARASFDFHSGWRLLTTFGIAKDEQANVWHAGHLTDALVVDRQHLLLASATGGVWLVFLGTSTPATPLSNAWALPDMRCLGRGSRGSRHVYAGGDSGALFETETQSLRSVARFLQVSSLKIMVAAFGSNSVRQILQASDAPLFDWKQIALVSPGGVSLGQPPINRLVAVPGLQPPKLVLATDNGVFWSDVPPLGTAYRFVPAEGVPARPCWGVARTADNRIVASPTGNAGDPGSNGIYVGTWESNKLVMRRAAHSGDIEFVKWNETVLASSAVEGSFLYASVSDTGLKPLSLKRAFRRQDLSTFPLSVKELARKANVTGPISVLALASGADAVYAVLHSDDNGETWSPVGPHGKVDESVNFTRWPGFYQYATWCLAVSSADSNTIALGTRTGPVIGRRTSGAFTWEDHGNETAPPGARSPHLHGDVHGLHFDPRDFEGQTLYVCGDGGAVVTTDLCRSFSSLLNRGLPTLQFQSFPAHPYASPFLVAFPGASGASFTTPGLVAGPLQDNGVVFSSRSGNSQAPWHRVTPEDDGLLGIFLKNDLLLFWNNDDPIARVAKWDGTKFGDATRVTVRKGSPAVPSGSTFNNPFVEPVLRPAFRRTDVDQTMIAVAAYDISEPVQDLWGLFTDDDGGNPFWDFLATVNVPFRGSVTAAGSDNGFTVLAGSQNGLIFSVDTQSGEVNAMAFDPFTLVSGQVFQLAFLNGGVAIARYQNALLRFTPSQGRWAAIEADGLPSDEGPFYFIAVDTTRDPNILYAATDYGVHASWDAGVNWLPVSQGLPAHCHPSTLRFVAPLSGSRELYLFTFGRSAWRADLK